MTRVLTALALLPVLLLTSCGCFSISTGEMTVSTDCGKPGTNDFVAGNPFKFAKAPDAFAKGLGNYFGVSSSVLSSVEGALNCPSTSSSSCDARGAGAVQSTSSSALAQKSGAALCGSRLIAVGNVTDSSGNPIGIYVCQSEHSAVSDQLWIMDCQRYAADKSPLGSCHGLAEYKITAGL